MLCPTIRETLSRGVVIPAHPLALDNKRRLDERHQRALSRYYLAAGAGGLAVGVHTTQFEIHDPQVGLYEPVLALAAEEMDRVTDCPIVRVAGLVGRTDQAVREATIARDLGYHTGLLSLAAMAEIDGVKTSERELIQHCRAVAEVMPLFGFYLQPDVGGLNLSYSFWRQFAEIDNVVAIKIAAFNRYRTFDVIRAVAESGRNDIALYTGNDDNIVLDLLSTYRIDVNGKMVKQRFVGGLLGHWTLWTRRAVELLSQCHTSRTSHTIDVEMFERANEVTDCNAAFFDAANGFAGCIPGILEILRRQGLVANNLCLDEKEQLSPGQMEEIDRVCRSYPHLNDDIFVKESLDTWLS